MRLSLNPKRYEEKILDHLGKIYIGNRHYVELLELEIIDDEYYRALVKFVDYFNGDEFEDNGIFFIQKENI